MYGSMVLIIYRPMGLLIAGSGIDLDDHTCGHKCGVNMDTPDANLYTEPLINGCMFVAVFCCYVVAMLVAAAHEKHGKT